MNEGMLASTNMSAIKTQISKGGEKKNVSDFGSMADGTGLEAEPIVITNGIEVNGLFDTDGDDLATYANYMDNELQTEIDLANSSVMSNNQ